MQKRWRVKNSIDSTSVEELRSKLKIDRVVAELLLQRNITSFEDAQTFFRPDLNDLHDPFLMKDMITAVDRLAVAIEKSEKILLFGDYDVDGTTAVALMYAFLKNKIEVDFYIPDRYTEGYGLSEKGIDYAKENKFDIIVSLDCGIKSNELIQYARDLEMDFIVCDHHTPGEELPNAIVLDPKRIDCNYPFKELSGCGVGFKLLQGLCVKEKWSYDELYSQLDLLALSIGADIVDVTGENRILCYHGLKLLNESPRIAFKELLILANRQFPVTLTDVIFTIAPRINAAGRLRSGRFAVQLMISENVQEINELAEAINEDNTLRRELDQQITKDALTIIEEDTKFDSKSCTIVYNPDWHKGVVGIVASRLIEKHYRPTIVLTKSNGLITGSARSVEGFNLYDAIDHCSDLLEQFGGHTHAAGLSLKEENLEEFKEKFNSFVEKSIKKEQKVEEQQIDIALSFDEIFTTEENRMRLPKLKRILAQFEPHGPGNMKPVFISENVFSDDVRLLKDAHLKLQMMQPNNDVKLEAIGFNLADKMDFVASGVPFDVVYTLEVNRWRDRETLQLNVKDIRPNI